MLLGGLRYLLPVIAPPLTFFVQDLSNLPVATKIANEVICLPMYHELSDEDINRVLNTLIK